MTVQALDIADELAETGGFDKRQAEAIGRILARSLEEAGGGMATKADIALVRSDMERLKSELLLSDSKQRNAITAIVGGLLAVFLALDKLILT